MHKTLLTFKHNLKAVLNGAVCLILMAVLKASTARSNKSNEQLLAILILLNLLTRIRLEENLYKEKEPNSLINCLILILLLLSTGFLIECQALLQRKKSILNITPKD
jgi:uncharacterized membrane protein